MRHVPSPDIPANVLSKDWGYHAVYPILKLILFFSWNTANLIQEGWPIQWHPPFLDILYRITCFAFYILFCKGLEMMGSDKICTTSCIYVHVLSLCHCYALLVTWRIWMRTLRSIIQICWITYDSCIVLLLEISKQMEQHIQMSLSLQCLVWW
jgi:hypothetical protein